MAKNNKKYHLMVFILLGTLLIIAGSASAEVVPSNIIIEGVDISGLELKEAEGKLRSHFREIVFSHQDLTFGYAPEEVGIFIDYPGTLLELMERPPWELQTINYHGVELSLAKYIDEEIFTARIAEIARTVDSPAQDARFEIVDNGLVTRKESSGIRVDTEFFTEFILNSTLKNSYIIPIVVVNPEITTRDIERLKPDTLLSQYTSQFVVNNNRTENIRIASEAIKGTLLAPGEAFSFNKVVGPRSKEAGYLTAMVISGGRFVPGIGGGICQVSSTLYNSVLLAGLEIKERSAHSLAIDYVPLGRDATVVYGIRDFKFINNTPGYLLLDYHIEGQRLTFSIYGSSQWAEKVQVLELKTEVLRTIGARTIENVDGTLAPGQVVIKDQGKPGYEVATYRLIKIDQDEIREYLSKDIYQPTSRIINRGPN